MKITTRFKKLLNLINEEYGAWVNDSNMNQLVDYLELVIRQFDKYDCPYKVIVDAQEVVQEALIDWLNGMGANIKRYKKFDYIKMFVDINNKLEDMRNFYDCNCQLD